MVAAAVRGCAVEAAVAVDLGIDVEAAAKRAIGVGDPFVEVAVEVVDALGGDAHGVAPRGVEAVGQLVDARVVHLPRRPVGGIAK